MFGEWECNNANLLFLLLKPRSLTIRFELGLPISEYLMVDNIIQGQYFINALVYSAMRQELPEHRRLQALQRGFFQDSAWHSCA